MFNLVSQEFIVPDVKKRKLQSFSNYVSSFLQKIGSGSSRTVFAIDDKTCLKVAKNKKGLDQNIEEANIYIQREYGSIVAKVFDSDNEDIFLVSEFAPKPKPTQFKNIVGATVDEVGYYLKTFDPRNNRGKYLPDERLAELSENEWLMDLLDLAVNYDYMIPGDFQSLSSYGIVNRDGTPQIVITDLGFTRSVFDSHYKR